MGKNKVFQGHLGEYQIIETEDNSLTLYSQHFDENCHSLSGAWDETLYNYIEGCELSRWPEKLSIFEVGLGAGIGYLATLKTFEEKGLRPYLTFISTEIEPALIPFCQEVEGDFGPYPSFSELEFKAQDGLEYYEAQNESGRLIILQGDARLTTQKAFDLNLFDPVHAIYQDAFSPKKNPALWTVEWFHTLFNIAHQDSIMSTYSASSSIRKSMIEANWIVENRKGFGPKRASTRAFKKGEIEQDLLFKLERSPAKAIKDQDL